MINCHRKLRTLNVNQSPLKLKTFDNSDSPYHPSVLFFKDGWMGHKYFMVDTPFLCSRPIVGKYYKDRFECPEVHTSDDGLHWTKGKTNPIDNIEEINIDNLDYLSDPHLVFKDNQLECWYRMNHRHGNYNHQDDIMLLRKVSKDGINWSEREILADLSSEHPLGKIVISPAIIHEDDKYKMWYVDSINNERNILKSESPDGHIWTKTKYCKLEGLNVNPWHIDVCKIKNSYYLTVYDYMSLTLWNSLDGISFQFVKQILSPSRIPGSFYFNNLYRASLISCDKGFRLYFSADDLLKTYIGVMEGLTMESLKVISAENSDFDASYVAFIKRYLNIRKKQFQNKIQWCKRIGLKGSITLATNKIKANIA